MKSEVIQLIEGREDVTLTTYILDNSSEMLDGRKRPAIIICPGGAYLTCSDREGEPVALAFARMGYHAFVLRYSVYKGSGFGEGLSMQNMPVRKECVHPNPMYDIGRAMIYVKEHAEEWFVDEERIAICGFSAGAHNCAMYATYYSQPIVTDYFKLDKSKLRPVACILGYCLSDYIFMKELMDKCKNSMDAGFFYGSNTAFLGDDKYSDAKFDEVSPARHVNPDNPPTYLWATASDNMVPVQHTIRMAHALADQGIPFEMHIFEDGPHGLATADQASAEAKTQLYPMAAKWVDLCGTWLEKRLALPLPDISKMEALMASRMSGQKN